VPIRRTHNGAISPDFRFHGGIALLLKQRICKKSALRTTGDVTILEIFRKGRESARRVRAARRRVAPHGMEDRSSRRRERSRS
jgi:hypothetical protein